MSEPNHLTRARNAQRHAVDALNAGDHDRAIFWALQGTSCAALAAVEAFERYEASMPKAAPAEPIVSELEVSNPRGTFGHQWPCDLFYVGNWRAPGPYETGHRPLKVCTCDVGADE